MKGYNYPTCVYLNGEIVPAAEARISVFDRGYIFGDGVYEVIARINGQFFYEEPHWRRLQYSLDQIGIAFKATSLQAQVPALLKASGLESEDCLLYIQLTRGVAPRQHSFPKGITPTVLMYAWAKKLPEIDQQIAKVITREDFRWKRCDIKMTSLLGNVMANEAAMEQGAYETVFHRNGQITEASHCNVFFVKDGTVFTHPANHYILDGISRQVVLELCEKLRIPYSEEAVALNMVPQMDEAFLTGTSTQIRAIGEWDSHHFIQDGETGAITRSLQEAFATLKQD